MNKKKITVLFLFALLFLLTACGNVNDDLPEDVEITENTVESSSLPAENQSRDEEKDEAPSPAHQYIGNYEHDVLYQKVKEFEDCNDPEKLCGMLSELYGEEFYYVKMPYKTTSDPAQNKFDGYEEPYSDFICTAVVFFNTSHPLYKVPICSDTYLFFKEYNETPVFIMDSDASYIVSEYEMGTHVNSISSWVISDLFMCLHGYIDADDETKEFFCEAVRYMDFYLEFENLLIDKENALSNIAKTESLRPSIEILSVDTTGQDMSELTVKYQIKNISEKRGKVYLTFSCNAFNDELHFNDENFKNDYREDGCFEYKIHYFSNVANSVYPARLTILYGYGNFDPYDGWDNEIRQTVYILYTEDYGEISSNTIPADEIYPLYFDGEYIGAWTRHESGDLIEINCNSASTPFEKHNAFVSDEGHTLYVELSNGIPLFTLDGIYIGEAADSFEYDGITCYDLLYDGYFMVTRYPNDEYVRVQNAYSILGEGDVYMYPVSD